MIMDNKNDAPLGISAYWKSLKSDYTEKINATNRLLDKATKSKNFARKYVEHRLTFFKTEFGINLNRNKEWVEDEYKDGSLLKSASHIYRNLKEPKLREIAVSLLRYAQSCKTVSECNRKIKLYEKILNLDYDTYKDYIRKYYREVGRQLILNGYAYRFGGDVGCVCINRVKNVLKRPHIDSNATKARKAQLKAEGKEIFNREKADWCRQKGIEYNAERVAVYMLNNYYYQFVLIYSNLPDKFHHRFYPADSYGASVRGRHKEDFIQEANGDLNYICDLDISLRLKVRLCTEIDPTLYLNFIRYENQQSIIAAAYNRKNRQ